VPERTRAMRVGTLPRRSSTVRSGLRARSCARRRNDEVPTTAPLGSWSSPTPPRDTSASLGSTRVRSAPIASPGVSSVGRSLSEWTARSIRPSRSAVSISLVKIPLPPMRRNEARGFRSPVVSMTVTVAAPPGRSFCTIPLWASASALPRVPIRIRFLPVDSEELPHRVDPGDALALAVRAGEPCGGAMEELLHDAVHERLERRMILWTEAAAMAVQLLLRDLLEVGPERGHGRLHRERPVPLEESRHLRLDDGFHLGDLGAPLREALCHELRERVQLVHEHVRQLRDLRIHVPRHCEIEEEERPVLTDLHRVPDHRLAHD